MRLSTSLRTRLAADTAETARHLMPMLGVVEVVDVTSHDRLGLPVFFSSRPAGKTRRLHSGKGLTTQDAYVGALMEGMEFATAESASSFGIDGWLSHRQLIAQLPHRLSLTDFAPRLGEQTTAGTRIPVVRCEDLASGSSTLLPADLVLVPSPAYDPAPIFGWSTNGLASGNSLQEATLHALLEIAERDTVAMNLARDESALVDNSDLPKPFRQKAAQWHRSGIELIVRHLPNAFGLPCFEAGLHEPGSREVTLACGWGLHLDREIALSRAICEAAQARLVAMNEFDHELSFAAGDPTRAAPSARRDGYRDMLDRLTDKARQIDYCSVPSETARAVGPALRTVVSRLRACGLGPVFRRRMHFAGKPGALLGLQVVKLVVPRCEAIVDARARMGPRLMQRVLAAQ